MDTSDPDITFDDSGLCCHCRNYHAVVAENVFTGPDGRRRLEAKVGEIKAAGRGKRYDCIIGLSGGVDSTYVAWLVKSLGLRPLAVHLDNGWNTEIAVRNIHNIVTRLDIDLYTEVLEWEQFRRLQLAFLRASTPDCEIPTDHAIVATLYRTALREGLRFIIGGSNYATEQMLPPAWSRGHSDWKYIKAVNDRHGGAALGRFPHYTWFDRHWWFPHVRGLETVNILNFIDYDKQAAIRTMQTELGWVSYGGKHYESVYTRFYQGWILPHKFGFDKRRSHLSCLINAGQISRDTALAELQQPALDPTVAAEDKRFVIKKLGLAEAEFEALMAEPPKSFWDYPSYAKHPPAYDPVLVGLIAMIRRARHGLRLAGIFVRSPREGWQRLRRRLMPPGP
jgi:N-acetyl sugar amidotransferase